MASRADRMARTERWLVDPAAVKSALRASLLSVPPPSPEVAAAVVGHVANWIEEHRPGTVVGFLAMGDEIDITPLVDRFSQIRFGLTRTAAGADLTVHDFYGPRERHPYGFEQPAPEAPPIAVTEIDVVLVPGVAFSRAGRRLGRGAGHYDRFLARLSHADKIAVTTESRLRDDIPLEPHDVAVDWIATEHGIWPAPGE